MVSPKSSYASAAINTLAMLVAAAVTLAACGGGGGGGGGSSSPINTAASNDVASGQNLEQIEVNLKALNEVDPCADLRAYLLDYAEQSVRKQLEATRESAGRGTAVVGGDVAATGSGIVAVSAPAPAASANMSAGSAASSAATSFASATQFTTTNIQTVGIDELDTVKNDGRNVYQLHRAGAPGSGITGPVEPSSLTVLTKSRYWPADQMAVLGQLSLAPFNSGDVSNASYYAGASTHGMFLTESAQVVVLRSVDSNIYPLAVDAVASANASTALPPSAAARSASLCPMSGCVPFNTPSSTRLDIIDAAGSAAPIALASIEVAGRLLDARRKGNSVWLVTNQAFIYPSFIRWWPADFDFRASLVAQVAKFDQLIAANTVAIRASSLREWLPADPTKAASAAEPTRAECAQYRKVSQPSELSWLRVASVNLADRSVSQQIIMAQGQMVYASARALYVGTPNWRGVSSDDPGPATFVHKFAIDQAGVANYVASGTYKGTPLNSYSFDEDDKGTLRFAANALQRETANANSAWQTYSYLGTMVSSASTLKVTGKSAPIAVGERMQSVRFIGPKAYLVTFRQVDPLFVFDMSSDGGPTQLGELKVPGFSTYLHPVGDRHLVGIGYDGGNWPRKIKASLFDVSDPRNPREQSTVTIGEYYSGSEALWDAHAFNYLARDAAAGTLAIPLWSYPWNGNGGPSSSLQLLNVSTATGLSAAGAILVNDQLGSSGNYYDYGDRFVRRSILADGYAFAVGNKLVRSASIAQPAKPIGTLLIP